MSKWNSTGEFYTIDGGNTGGNWNDYNGNVIKLNDVPEHNHNIQINPISYPDANYILDLERRNELLKQLWILFKPLASDLIGVTDKDTQEIQELVNEINGFYAEPKPKPKKKKDITLEEVLFSFD